MPVDTLTDPFLASEETSPEPPSATWSSGRKKTVTAIALGLLFTAGFAGYAGQVGFGEETTSSRASTSPKATDLAIVPFRANCYAFTGGTCLVKPCHASRGATCQMGKCICLGNKDGGCTGSDGVCHASNYEPSEGKSEDGKPIKITLTNVYWPLYKLYMPSFTAIGLGTSIKVERSYMARDGGQSAWYLYKLPGLLNGKKQYFLASAHYENWVAARSPTTVGIRSGLYAYNLNTPTLPYDPTGMSMHVCSLTNQGYKDSIMIGAPDVLGKMHWAYIGYGSWTVSTTLIADDPGEGGYWKVDHELKDVDDC